MVFLERAATSGSGRRRRCGDDRGAVLVEFAFVLPLLMMIVVGMFTGGLAWNRKLAVTNGVREGSRFGATLSVATSTCTSGTAGTVDCWLSQVADVTQSSSENELGSSVATRSVCVAYISTATTRSLTRTSSGDSYSNTTCFTDSRTDARVQVKGSRSTTVEFILFTVTPTLTSQAVTRFEAK